MVDYDGVIFNIAAFIGGLFVLEFGADKFIDHTAKVAARLRVPPTLITLLTAGAEWEELVVVIASISQSQSPLALGNILGSSISNILGAFSLGLIFSPSTPNAITFDTSAKIYTSVLFALTTLFTLFILFFQSTLGRFGGILLITTFGIYITSIAWAIYRGIVSPPEDDSDSDSDSESESDSDPSSDSETETESIPLKRKPKHPHLQRLLTSPTSSTTTLQEGDLESGLLSSPTTKQVSTSTSPPTSPLSKEHFTPSPPPNTPSTKPKLTHPPKSTLHHTLHLLLGLLSLSLSSYLLSHTLTTLSTLLPLSTPLLGTTLLSLATTLPEKLLSILSARRGQSGIIIANTAGSNIFLITLCAGVLFACGDLGALRGCVTVFEILCMWGSAGLLLAVVLAGGRRWMGWGLLVLYLGFLVLEFTADRR